MTSPNRKEMILSLLLATACGGNTVDLGRGGWGTWSDAPEQGGRLTSPQTIFETRQGLVFGIVADDTTLFALVGDSRSLELVSCPISRCGSERSVLYQGTGGATWFTTIVIADDKLYWKLSNHEPLGIASCPRAGCAAPTVIPLDISSGDQMSIGGDDTHVYVTDSAGSLWRLSPDDVAPRTVRDGLQLDDEGVMVAAGDFVHFTSETQKAVYRVRKDGTADAELVAMGEQITGLAASESALYFSTQILDGSIVECPLGAGVCGKEALLSTLRWPAGVRVDRGQLFWAVGNATFAEPKPGSIWSCDLPGCSAPRERVAELFLAPGAGSRSLQPGNFTFSRDFVIWLEHADNSAMRIRRLAR